MFEQTLAVALPTSLLMHLKYGTNKSTVDKVRAIGLIRNLGGHDVSEFYKSEPADVLNIEHEIENGSVIQICLTGEVTTLRLTRN